MTRRAADRRQESVDGRRTGREEEVMDGRVERQIAMPLQGRDQAGQDHLEALPADAIRGLPEDDECFTDRLRIDPPTGLRRVGREAIDSGEQPDRVLAMAAGNVHELIQDLRFINF